MRFQPDDATYSNSAWQFCRAKARSIGALVISLTVFRAMGQDAQPSQNMATRLHAIKELHCRSCMPATCGDSAYWAIVKEGAAVIPKLIDLVKDSSATSIMRPCSTEPLTIGELAFVVCDEIIGVPYALVLKHQFCTSQFDCDLDGPDGVLSVVRHKREIIVQNMNAWFKGNRRHIKRRKLNDNPYWNCRRQQGLNYMLGAH